MESFTKEVGKEIYDKAMEYRFGLMELDTKDNGIKIKPMEKVNLYILMEISMMDNG